MRPRSARNGFRPRVRRVVRFLIDLAAPDALVSLEMVDCSSRAQNFGNFQAAKGKIARAVLAIGFQAEMWFGVTGEAELPKCHYS